jgi:protein-S-isoprenylcysteine O-methyltransferase Ste14
MRDQKGCCCAQVMVIILGVIFIVLPILTWLEIFAELSMPLWLGIVLIILGLIGLICGFICLGKNKCGKPAKEEPKEPAAPSQPTENAGV